MKLYHGTNTNALEGITKAGYKLLSRRELMRRNIPLFSGDLNLNSAKCNHVVLFSDKKRAEQEAQIPFSYRYLINIYQQIERLKSINNKRINESHKNHLAYSLRTYQRASREKREELFFGEPVMFEFNLDPNIIKGTIESNSEDEIFFRDSFNILPYITDIYISVDNFKKIGPFYHRRWREFSPLSFHNEYFPMRKRDFDSFITYSIKANIHRFMNWPKIDIDGALTITSEQDNGNLTLTEDTNGELSLT